MEFRRLHIPEVVLLVPPRSKDQRGWFAETYNAERLKELGSQTEFLQDNHAYSREAGTVRGLHFQHPPLAQAKLVRVIRGAIYDVAVDLRKESASYGKFAAMKLSAEGGEQLFIPAGFAHGYCTLEPDTVVTYKVTAPYAPAAERGLRWNDPVLGLDRPVAPDEHVLSERDRAHPLLADVRDLF
jgi:dTDP-4-dehydrorhamnose 3,5-epimerase